MDMRHFIKSLSTPNQLEQIYLCLCGIGDQLVACLISALHTMSNLLEFGWDDNTIGMKACSALGVLISNSKLSIHKLDLLRSNFDNKCIQILTCALINNNTIMVLNLVSGHRVTSLGWSILTSYLLNPNCSLRRLCLILGQSMMMILSTLQQHWYTIPSWKCWMFVP